MPRPCCETKVDPRHDPRRPDAKVVAADPGDDVRSTKLAVQVTAVDPVDDRNHRDLPVRVVEVSPLEERDREKTRLMKPVVVVRRADDDPRKKKRDRQVPIAAVDPLEDQVPEKIRLPKASFDAVVPWLDQVREATTRWFSARAVVPPNIAMTTRENNNSNHGCNPGVDREDAVIHGSANETMPNRRHRFRPRFMWRLQRVHRRVVIDRNLEKQQVVATVT